jgi:hypothetical protein
MSNLYITEYRGVGTNASADNGMSVQAAKAPALAEQKVSFTGTPGLSAAFGANTRLVRIHVDGIASIRFSRADAAGAGSNAAVTNKRMAADATEYFAVDPGMFVSAITNT